LINTQYGKDPGITDSYALYGCKIVTMYYNSGLDEDMEKGLGKRSKK
jgi:hypothetical protein